MYSNNLVDHFSEQPACRAGKKDPSGEWGSEAIYDYACLPKLQRRQGFRIYNPSIAKFLSVDPLTASYPWYTPYQFAGNKPIASIDMDGLEEYIAIKKYMIYDSEYGKPSISVSTIQDAVRRANNMNWKHPRKTALENAFTELHYYQAYAKALMDAKHEFVKQDNAKWGTGEGFSKLQEEERYVQGRIKELRGERIPDLVDKQIASRKAWSNKVKANTITLSDYGSVILDISGVVISAATAEFGVGITGLGVSVDNLQADVMRIYDKANMQYDPNKPYTLGGKLESTILGEEKGIYSATSILISIRGAQKATIRLLDDKGKEIDAFDAILNIVSGIKTTKELIEK